MTIHQPTDATRTDLVEFNTHSFVIKIWFEVTPNETKKRSWRGHITHIPSGERRYVTNLFGILTFMMRYLKAMGIRVDRFWWIKDKIAGLQGSTSDSEGENSSLPPSTQWKETKPHQK